MCELFSTKLYGNQVLTLHEINNMSEAEHESNQRIEYHQV